MGATPSSPALGPGDVFHSVNFTHPIGGGGTPVSGNLNYTSSATPYYELAYRNFTELTGSLGSTVCEGVCTSNEYDYGTLFNTGLFGVDSINTTASSFDLYSFQFGCAPILKQDGGDNRNAQYAATANCTLTFSGYAAGAEYGLPPVAPYSHYYSPKNQPSPYTGLPIAQPDNVTLPASFKNLKYVYLSAVIPQSDIDSAAAYNETVVGTKVILAESQYITHHLVRS